MIIIENNCKCEILIKQYDPINIALFDYISQIKR